MNPAIIHARALIEGLFRSGIRHACISPGSRSAPVALAIADREGIELHVGTDERSVAFMALGIAKVSGRPVLVVTTSGSAAANLHPAVVEANLGEVPMIVITADRPPELQGVKAPQTMDQTHLFGSAVRWFYNPGVPDPSDTSGRSWAWLARRAYEMATGHPGPVHLNLPFREPLHPDGDEPSGGELVPEPSVARQQRSSHSDEDVQALASLSETERGLIVVGTSRLDPSSIRSFAAATGWPVIAEAASRARMPGCITMYDLLLREPMFASRMKPDIVVRLGDPGISKNLMGFLRSTSTQIAITSSPTVADPDRSVGTHIRCSPEPLLDEVSKTMAGSREENAWRAAWLEAEAKARQTVDVRLDATDVPSEPRTARDLYDALPTGSRLMVASSMPIRELDWFMRAREDVDVLANRGVNGIDGFTSTVTGIAVEQGEAFGLCGDLAFLHDLSGLAMAAQIRARIRLTVLNNDGGGIFNFLPYAQMPGDSFERVFGTPHGHDLAAVASALGVRSVVLENPVDLAGHLQEMRSVSGPALLEVRTDRRANEELHHSLWDSGRQAIRELFV